MAEAPDDFEADMARVKDAVTEAVDQLDLRSAEINISAKAIGDSGYITVKGRRTPGSSDEDGSTESQFLFQPGESGDSP